MIQSRAGPATCKEGRARITKQSQEARRQNRAK